MRDNNNIYGDYSVTTDFIYKQNNKKTSERNVDADATEAKPARLTKSVRKKARVNRQRFVYVQLDPPRDLCPVIVANDFEIEGGRRSMLKQRVKPVEFLRLLNSRDSSA